MCKSQVILAVRHIVNCQQFPMFLKTTSSNLQERLGLLLYNVWHFLDLNCHSEKLLREIWSWREHIKFSGFFFFKLSFSFIFLLVKSQAQKLKYVCMQICIFKGNCMWSLLAFMWCGSICYSTDILHLLSTITYFLNINTVLRICQKFDSKCFRQLAPQQYILLLSQPVFLEIMLRIILGYQKSTPLKLMQHLSSCFICKDTSLNNDSLNGIIYNKLYYDFCS